MATATLVSGHSQPLPEIVYRQLRSAILNGMFPPGSPLRQEEIAQKLGVSRNPVREALPRLESEGIVVLSPRRGYTVAQLEPSEIRDVFALRTLLETELVRRAVELKTHADDDRILSILDQMTQLAAQAQDVDRVRWFDLNLEFHDALMLPARYPHHMKALVQSRGVLEVYIRTEVKLTGDLDQAQREHLEMAQAFIAADGDLLVALTRQHSEHTRSRLLTGLAKTSLGSALGNPKTA
ncbi:GntR family transcriptional regulator [Pigmentiphaga sp. H8]|uniref:GntR family transcriptional regulator n=1 Tax=unclassified Pigmentiphaga TaxID=2626614 RepID=UPI000F596B42|nr:GntR family transcriptional regulator [Pigmentiphaga sp. H8]AZG09109.1 GntR family transcriptional regulator [Pigmentiphaga sp. H8]